MGWSDASTWGLIIIGAAVLVVLRLAINYLPGNTPPIFEGIPFIGGILKFLKGPLKLIDEGYKRHGEVFTVPVLHKKITFLIGPDVAPHFYKATDFDMSQEEVYKFNVPTFGKDVVFDVSHKVRAEQFKMFSEALKISKMTDYVPLFVKEAQDFFSKWEDTGVVNLVEVLAELIILTASRTLMGREIREQMFSEVKHLLHDLDAGLLPISVFFPYLPIPKHRARDRARDQLAAIFSKVIQARRASGASASKEHDMMQVFVESKYVNVDGGRSLKDHEIAGMLIATLFAGQHTSSITSSWTGYFMLTNKEKTYYPAVEEQRRIIKQLGPTISLDALNGMSVLHRNVQEAVRLHPPLILLLRQVHKDFTVTTSKGKSFVVPKGHIAATSPAYAHRLSSVFNQPDEFQPDRYEAPREEDKKKPFSYVGFGGGRHGCMGTNFAYLQIKTIWAVMLRNFEMEMVDPFPEADLDSMVVGPKPCRIRYTRRKAPLC